MRGLKWFGGWAGRRNARRRITVRVPGEVDMKIEVGWRVSALRI
ncbi:hypothetical protein [Terrabacter sp. BE26]